MGHTLYPIASLLAHRPPLLLLDEVIARDDQSITVGVNIRDDSLFLEGGAVPAHIGIEYMAQACGAYAGALALDAGEKVRLGFLLGTRNYAAYRSCFRVGERLVVTANVEYRDESMASFDVRIEVETELAAKARLAVYQPPETAVLLSGAQYD